jgi:hypothetical protein
VLGLFKVVDAFFADSSSVKMRMEGVQVSSNWPDLTAQMNPLRNAVARPRLARMRMRMTDILAGV